MSAAFNDARRPVARKPHRCWWCGETIPQGERHVQFVGTFKGDFQSWRMHGECYDAGMECDEIQEGFSPYENKRPL